MDMHVGWSTWLHACQFDTRKISIRPGILMQHELSVAAATKLFRAKLWRPRAGNGRPGHASHPPVPVPYGSVLLEPGRGTRPLAGQGPGTCGPRHSGPMCKRREWARGISVGARQAAGLFSCRGPWAMPAMVRRLNQSAKFFYI
jgi:hypothetical protein